MQVSLRYLRPDLSAVVLGSRDTGHQLLLGELGCPEGLWYAGRVHMLGKSCRGVCLGGGKVLVENHRIV